MMKNMLGLVNNYPQQQQPQPQQQPRQQQQQQQQQQQKPQQPAQQPAKQPAKQPAQQQQINNKNTPITPEIVEKMNVFYKLLYAVCVMLDEEKIPYYLDCGTLLGCIREGRLLLHDKDIDITIHLSNWEKLKEIDLSKYGVVSKRKYQWFPDHYGGNLISVYLENENPDYHCDIYANPAFPKLGAALMHDILYPVPKEPELYLKQLYGNWEVPSNDHADTEYHRNNGLIMSEYRKNWDLRYNIYKCKF
jgi:hypothetical protein